MSYEVWGDDDDGLDMHREAWTDQLLEDGWWSDDKAKLVVKAINDLFSTQVYEDGKKQNGINVEFIMRMNMLRYEAGMASLDEPIVAEAVKYFEQKEAEAAANAKLAGNS